MRATVVREVSEDLKDGDKLHLQLVIFKYDRRSQQTFFRFIRSSNGKLKAQRGQAGIPNLDVALRLIESMREITKDIVDIADLIIRR